MRNQIISFCIWTKEKENSKLISKSSSYFATKILIQFFSSYLHLLWTVPHGEANWKQWPAS